MFLTLFAWAEPSLRLDDPVRNLLRTAVLTRARDAATSRIFAIRHEMAVGNAHSTRAAFEHAVASEACRGSAGLWVAYIRFCFGRKELRAKTKDIFYRAVHACPFSKAVVMEAFTTLIRDMATSELKAVYGALQAKGLRVHVEMEGFVDGWQRKMKRR